MQGIVVKKCIVVKNSDASWVEIENFCPSTDFKYGLGLVLCSLDLGSLARQQLIIKISWKRCGCGHEKDIGMCGSLPTKCT